MVAALEADRIAEVVVVDGQRLEGLLESGDGPPQKFRTRLPVPGSDRVIERLEAAGVPIDAQSSGDALDTRLASFLAIFLVLALLVGLYLLRGSGSRALRHTGSPSRRVAPEESSVSFADVAGADEAKADLEEVVQFLQAPKRFADLGGRMPRGVLLAGDPGNGKTLLARAVSGEAGCAYFHASGSDFVEMYAGTGAARIRELFREVREHAPAIVFIDEIDAIGRRRGETTGSGAQDEREQALNQLLVEMDGFTANESVVVLAATNRSDVLDPALLRPGRFDRRVTVGYPDLKGRKGILQVHAGKLPLGADASLDALARGTAGMSGADLANIVNEAAICAARRDSTTVERRDLEEARDRVLLGSERKSVMLTPEEKRVTAYHEAGHAVVGLTLPELDPVHKVTIIPRERSLGVTASLPVRDQYTHSRAQLTGRLTMLLAGRAAEELHLGRDDVTTGAGNDIERATKIARQMVVHYGMSDRVGMVDASREDVPIAEHTARIVDEEIRRLVDEAHQRATWLLQEHEDLVHRMATALLDRETLERDELRALLDGAPLPPPPEGGEGATGPDEGPLAA